MKTTLNKIKAHIPCAHGWQKLLRGLNKTGGDDEPLSILKILEINGLDDALWCLKSVERHDREIRLYAVWCARKVQHLITDPNSIAALDVAERYANGLASEAELASARYAARASARAARASADASARYAAWVAVWVVSEASADAAVRSADAARAAAWVVSDAAADAVRSAAWVVSEAAQRAELVQICSEMEPLQVGLD